MTRGAIWLSGAALAWAVALLVGAFLVAVYESDSSAGGTTSDTLVAVNGAGSAAVVAVPLVAAALVLLALRTGHRTVAWAIVGVLVAFCLVAILTIGVFVAPAAILLGLAVQRDAR